MSFEQKINYQLNKFPAIKKVIKRAYQLGMYAISPKIKSEGNIIRVSPDDKGHEYFFGYYDKSPWDITDRYMLCMRANDTWSDVSPKEKADIILIDTQKAESDPNRIKKIAETRAWNVQQSCMLQWMGPDYSSKILYNDYRNGAYCSIIKELSTGEERIIPAAVYTVSADGKFALTLDFSRLYNLRPGYGYYNVPETTKGVALPDATAIWTVDLENGEVKPLLNYIDFASFQPRPEMQEKGSIHKVNHLMLSPNGKRFMVLYRWFNGQRKYTRLVTCNVDGTDMYVLSDDDMVSHCFWKDDTYILAFENKRDGGPGYYLMADKTQRYSHCWPQFTSDGHPSYSPDRSLVVTDSYPDRARIASINVMDGDESKKEHWTIAKVFAPFKYDNDTRCDLHPRWNHAGDKVCFDSIFEGHRGLYTIDVSDLRQYKSINLGNQPYVEIERKEAINTTSSQTKVRNEISTHINDVKLSVIVPIYKVEKYLKRCVDSILNQTYTNLELILIDDGSPDRCGQMCDAIAGKDSRVKVIHKINGGLSSARNAGIEAATGDYIAFVDSDDWVDLNIYNRCIDMAQSLKCEVVDFKAVFATDETKICNSNISDSFVLEGEEILYDYLYRGQTESCPFSVCRKVYLRRLFDDIRFPEGKINEDIVTNFRILQKCKRLVHISDIGYFYFQGNSNSITSGILKKKDFDLLTASHELCELSKKCSDLRILELSEIKLSRSYFSLLAKAATGGIGDDISSSDMRFLKRELRKNYRRLMKAPIPLNRKLFISMIAIDYRCVAVPYGAIKLILKI